MTFHPNGSNRYAKVSAIALLAIICLGLPLLGGWLLGMSWVGFWSLPMQPQYMGYIPFAMLPNVFYWLVVVALVTWWLRGHFAARPSLTVPRVAAGRFPWWGRLAAVLLGCFWVLAWTRFAWFAPLQAHTFTPIWLSFIVLLNAFVVKRTGSCPLLDDTVRYLSLFPMSAVFWWVFEYFNRFVHNWIYHGVEDWSPAAYALHASLAFSTVLPAVLAMVRLLETFPGLQGFLARGPALPKWLLRKQTAFWVLGMTAVGFFLIGEAPSLFFPLLWSGPVLVWLCANALFGTPLNLGGVSEGNWAWVLTWALAGLACGFCWELWNVFSLAKWTYQIPWFETLYVFEMPLAGYLGYLPFGLECGLVVMALEKRRFLA